MEKLVKVCVKSVSEISDKAIKVVQGTYSCVLPKSQCSYEYNDVNWVIEMPQWLAEKNMLSISTPVRNDVNATAILAANKAGRKSRKNRPVITYKLTLADGSEIIESSKSRNKLDIMISVRNLDVTNIEVIEA